MALASMTQAHVPAEVSKDWLLGLKAFAAGEQATAKAAALHLHEYAKQHRVPSLEFAARQLDFLNQHASFSGYNFMGIMGGGKSSIASAFAKRLSIQFQDADIFHTEAAKTKLAAGKDLDDSDRIPCIKRVAEFYAAATVAEPRVSTYSALKDSLRAAISGASIDNLHEMNPNKIWGANIPNAGLIQILIYKPYELALEDLDRAAKDPSTNRGIAGAAHFIRVTKENPELLRRQYQAFELTAPKDYQALTVNVADYRNVDGSYDTAAIVEDLIQTLPCQI